VLKQEEEGVIVNYSQRSEVYSTADVVRAAGVPYSRIYYARLQRLIPEPTTTVAGGMRRYYTAEEMERIVNYFRGREER
jgi:hypothetical protein